MSPKKFGPKEGGSYLDRARRVWNGTLPDWVEALARAADRAPSQAALNAKLKFKNASVISAVIGKTYPGKLDKVEVIVRGALMHETVACPQLGALGKDQCLANQRRKFSASSPHVAQLWRACRGGCRHALADALKEGN